MHAGLSLITVNPFRLDEWLKLIRAEVGPMAERVGGSLGVSLRVSTDLGIAVIATLWVSDDALRAGERVIAVGRDEAVRRTVGTLTAEQFVVPVFEQEAPVVPGACVRLTRIGVAPSTAEDAIEVFGDTAVPWPADTKGFCRILYLVHRSSGCTVSESRAETVDLHRNRCRGFGIDEFLHKVAERAYRRRDCPAPFVGCVRRARGGAQSRRRRPPFRQPPADLLSVLGADDRRGPPGYRRSVRPSVPRGASPATSAPRTTRPPGPAAPPPPTSST